MPPEGKRLSADEALRTRSEWRNFGIEAPAPRVEPAAPRASNAYAKEHAEIFAPIRQLFAMVREIATAVTHEVGAFG